MIGGGEILAAWKLGKAGLNRLTNVAEDLGIIEPSSGRKRSEVGEVEGPPPGLEPRIRNIIQLVRQSVDGADDRVRKVTGAVLGRQCDGQLPARARVAGSRFGREEMSTLLKEAHRRLDYISNDRSDRTARKTLDLKRANCANASIVLASMFRVAGYEAQFKVVAPKEKDADLHVYVLGQDPASGEWLGADATEARFLGWEPLKSKILWSREYRI